MSATGVLVFDEDRVSSLTSGAVTGSVLVFDPTPGDPVAVLDDGTTDFIVITAGGPPGPAGADGADGAPGAPGVGVPAGGTTDQVLKKASNADYDFVWGVGAASGAVSSVNTQTGDVVLDAAAVGADPTGTAAGLLATHSADTTGVHGITDTAALVVTTDPRMTDARTPTAHDHDDRYYTETEIDTALTGKVDDTDPRLTDARTPTAHSHPISDVTALQTALDGKSDTSHTHTLDALSDVATAGATDGQALLFDTGTGTWGPGDAGGAGGTVNSVNTQTGDVVLNAADVGADAAGTAAGLVTAHEADTTAVHGITDTSALVVTTDPRMTDSRTPTAHNHPADQVTETAGLKVMTAAERTKLAGVADSATANATDAQLRDRTTHTGSQAISTVTGLQTALDAKVEAYTYAVTGDVAVATGKSRVYLEDAMTLVSVRAAVGTAPNGSVIYVDVNKNGATIYGTQANRPTIFSGTNDALGGAASVTTFAAGDYLTVDVDGIGTTTPGADLTVTIRLRKT